MKIRWIILLTFIAILAISGCSSADTPEVPEGAEEINLPIVQQEESAGDAVPAAYPAPSSSGLAYPADSAEANPNALFPELESETNITWEQASAMIVNGEVRMIRVKGEPTDVTIGLIDGRTFYAVATDQIVVINTIRECGEACLRIPFYQE